MGEKVIIWDFSQHHEHGELFWYAHILYRFLSLLITPIWHLLAM